MSDTAVNVESDELYVELRKNKQNKIKCDQTFQSFPLGQVFTENVVSLITSLMILQLEH